jgi:nitrate reductase NapAB chaperone NapD
MPISALVVQLETQRAVSSVEAQLSNDERITLGRPQGTRLPVVTETQTLRESRDLALDLEQLPGVLSVELVFANFEDLSIA